MFGFLPYEVQDFFTNNSKGWDWDNFYHKYKDKLKGALQNKTKEELKDYLEIMMSQKPFDKVKNHVDLGKDEIETNNKTLTPTQELILQSVNVNADPHTNPTKANELIEKTNSNAKKSNEDYNNFVKNGVKKTYN